jgi:hypothetical protein
MLVDMDELAQIGDTTIVALRYHDRMSSKERLSASVDADLIAEAQAAVAAGRAESVSAWVNDAMRAKVEHDRGLAALAAFIADFESEHGEITGQEMREATRKARSNAVVVRGRSRTRDGNVG